MWVTAQFFFCPHFYEYYSVSRPKISRQPDRRQGAAQPSENYDVGHRSQFPAQFSDKQINNVFSKTFLSQEIDGCRMEFSSCMDCIILRRLSSKSGNPNRVLREFVAKKNQINLVISKFLII
jgi:hypothetical protein